MLQPKRTKYRKTQKGRNEGLAYVVKLQLAKLKLLVEHLLVK